MAESPVRGFSHIQLRVKDVARSVDWWCAALGLSSMGEPLTATGIDHGGLVESGGGLSMRWRLLVTGTRGPRESA